MNSKLETLIQNVIESITLLKEYVDSHTNAQTDYEFLDELNEANDMLNEVAYDLECRASDSEEEE